MGMKSTYGIYLLVAGVLVVRIPVLQMTVFTRLVDSIAGIQKELGVFLVDRFQRFHRRIVKTMHQLHKGRAVLSDHRIDLLGCKFDLRFVGLLTGMGNMSARYKQQIRSL